MNSQAQDIVMHKTVCFFLVIFSLVSDLSGQEDAFVPTPREKVVEEYVGDNGLLATSAGICFPLGNFAFKEADETEAGFAKTGFTINFLEASHFLAKHVGIGIRWNRHQFGYDHEGFVDWYRIRIPNAVFYARSEDPWVMHTAIANLIGILPGEIADLDVRLGFGYTYVKRPEVFMEGYDRVTGYFQYSWLQKEAVTSGLVFGFGTNVRLHLDQDIDLIMTWDVQRTTARMNVENVLGVVNEEVVAVDQPISLIALGLGVGIRL